VDPTEAQWRELSELIKEKEHFPFFDMVHMLSNLLGFGNDAHLFFVS
jgi:aspartate/tyrosine/aromatic aminotransferase